MNHRTHLRASLVLVAVFLALGLWLEARIGLRAQALTDDPLRREFLRLGHAHGGILGLLNLILGFTMARLATPEAWARRLRLAAWLGAAFVGSGFLFGGLWHGPTDPGPTVLLVPAGAMLLLVSLVAVAITGPDRSHEGRQDARESLDEAPPQA